MSTISPMTPRPQPATSGEQPVVSLQQRLADRLAQAPQDVQAGARKKKERTGEEALALHAAAPRTIRDHAEDTGVSRRDGAPSIVREHGQSDPFAGTPQASDAPRARAGGEEQQALLREPALSSTAIEEPVARGEASPSPIAGDTTELPTTGPVAPVRSEAAATTMTTPAAAEATPVAPRWASATPAPVAPPPQSGNEGSSVTVAFQSWGPGHEVRAQWLPGGGVLVPGSDRVGLALSAAASQPDAAIAGDNWRVERTDADAEQRERPRGDAEQDA